MFCRKRRGKRVRLLMCCFVFALFIFPRLHFYSSFYFTLSLFMISFFAFVFFCLSLGGFMTYFLCNVCTSVIYNINLYKFLHHDIQVRWTINFNQRRNHGISVAVVFFATMMVTDLTLYPIPPYTSLAPYPCPHIT